MGREAKVMKHRVCRSCRREIRFTAKQLIAHSLFCKRLKELNLTHPDSERSLILP